MKRVELELEHHFKNKFVGRHRFKSTDEMPVLGATRDANIRLLGDGVSGVHAILEYNKDRWVLCDMGSEHGTWVKKKPIVEYDLTSTTVVRIGGHTLKIVPRVIEGDLFKKDVDLTKQSDMGAELYHQVIVRKAGFVVTTEILAPNQPFIFKHGGKPHSLPAPKDGHWQKTTFGEAEVQQRLVKSTEVRATVEDRVKGIFDPSLRLPMGAALVVLLIVTGLVMLAPSQPDGEFAAVKPKDNKYSRMIFDAKAVRKKRQQAQKLRKTIETNTQHVAAVQPVKSQKAGGDKKVTKSATKQVITKIKTAGLSQLLGKISKRAAKTATLVQATGVAADSPNAGRAIASVGSLGKVAKASGVGTGTSYKVAGVGTEGRGGGQTGSVSGIGGLSASGVGTGTVGILEEETEIEGGLDRDVISRVIKSQLGQIRYCYERQLSASPDMYGKVLVNFTIGAQGSVVTQTIGLSTLNSAMVEGCILRRVAGWRFPQPKGGTSVLVTYPFLFKSTN